MMKERADAAGLPSTEETGMPARERTSREEIVRAGRALLESEGLARLTMQSVADRVGVRAPSLYKRLRNRDELIALIAEATLEDLGERIASIASTAAADPARTLGELARALRGFAHAQPAGYGLIFGPAGGAPRPSADSLARASAPLLRVTAALAGAEVALEAARTVTAWANGFISMELAGNFELGGDVDRAFEFGIERLVGALDRSGIG